MCAVKSESRLEQHGVSRAPARAPQRRKLDFRTLDAVADDVDRLHRYGYTPLGRWNLAKICDHLSLLMRFSLEGFPFKFPWIMRQVVGPLIIKPWMLRTRQFPKGVDAPKEVLPAQQIDEEQAVEAFKAMLWRVRDQRGKFQPSPLLGPLTNDQWRQIHMIHCAHHLAFLLPKGE